MTERLSTRALGRATLARQLLLRRERRPAVEVVEHLVGMQAQAALAPYVGLWSRLDDCDPDALAQALLRREVVRAPLMRATVHLVSARDARRLRPLVQPVLARSFAGLPIARVVAAAGTDKVVAHGRALLAERPMTRAQLGPVMAQRWPDVDPTALAYAVSYLAPLVQVPPRGVWGRTGPAAWAPVETWLGAPLDPAPSVDELVLRYLAAFGPATVRDVQAWSGLTRLREVAERLGPRLRTFAAEDGATLHDLPEAPRPDEDEAAPVRYLPEYDNLLLCHADRSRFMDADRRTPLPPGGGASFGTLLLDGRYAATWRVTRSAGAAVALDVEPFAVLPTGDRDAVEAEGRRLLAFLGSDGTAEVRVHSVG